MFNYNDYCPISKAAEVVGERWSILILREMLLGAKGFNQMARGLPGISRTLLSSRLRSLERRGLVEREDGSYALTPAGHDLAPIIFGLGHWAQTWIIGDLDDLDPDEIDPTMLMWWHHTRLQIHVLPERERTVLEFRFVDHPARYWIVVERGGASLCDHDPGFGVQVVITTDRLTLHNVWDDQQDFRAAVRAEKIRLEGSRAVIRALPDVMRVTSLGEMAEAAWVPVG